MDVSYRILQVLDALNRRHQTPNPHAYTIGCYNPTQMPTRRISVPPIQQAVPSSRSTRDFHIQIRKFGLSA